MLLYRDAQGNGDIGTGLEAVGLGGFFGERNSSINGSNSGKTQALVPHCRDGSRLTRHAGVA